MPISGLIPILPLAQALGNESTSTTLELDWPESARDWVLFAGFALAIVYVVWMYLRDTRTLSPIWTVWLTGLRLAVVAALIVIALNPQQRTQKDAYRPSQVALLVDTSTSMQQSATDPRSSGEQSPESRAAAVHKLLAESPLVQELQKVHHVDLYTFDSDRAKACTGSRPTMTRGAPMRTCRPRRRASRPKPRRSPPSIGTHSCSRAATRRGWVTPWTNCWRN
jgi:hypothetical protein